MSATNRGTKLSSSDYYPTPLSAFEPLLPYFAMLSNYWEPACGDKRLIKCLCDHGFCAHGDDIINGYDFLLDETIRDIIITNPPYTYAFEFVQHAVSHASEVYMLLRLNFLASLKRRQWFINHEPSALFVLSQRPSFRRGHGTDACDYAWFYWGRKQEGIWHI